MAWIILKQAAIMLLLNLVGIIAYRTKIVDKNGGRQFSSFVLEIVTPVLVVNAYSEVEYEFRLVVNMLWTFLIAAISYVVAITAAYLLIRRKAGRETEIERFSVIYSNCGFMGIPLASALLGNEGAVLRHGVPHHLLLLCVDARHHAPHRTARPPCPPEKVLLSHHDRHCHRTGAVFCRIQLPGILQTTFDYVAGLNTPMAMVASGISVAQANLLQAVRTPRVYYVSAVKLLGIPLLLTLLFLPLSFIPMEVRTVVLVLMAAPSAAMCTLQCQKHSMNDVYASGIFAMTTILSMAAMPAVVKLFTTLLELVSA